MERIDSLLNLLPASINDTNKVILLNDLSFNYKSIHPDTGLLYGQQAIDLSVKLGFKKGEADALLAMAANYWVKHDYVTEEQCLRRQLDINKALDNKQEIARTIRNIGDIYETEYNYPKALSYYKEALAIAEKINNSRWILNCQASIANICDLQKNYAEALEYFQKCVQYCEATNNTIDLAGYLRRAGLVLAEQGNYNKALEYEKKSLSLFKSLKNNPFKDHLAWTLRDLGTVYCKQGNYQQSLLCFRQAYGQFIVLPGIFPKNNAGICLAKMGNAYLQIALHTNKEDKLYKTQLKHAKDTLALAINMLKPSDWTSLTDALQDMVKVYQLQGNYRASLEAYEEYSSYKDSLYNTEIEKKVLMHEMEFENEIQKDSIKHANLLQVAQLNFLMERKELDRLKNRQQTIYLIIAFATICLVSFYFLYSNYHAKIALRNELAKERIEQQLKEAEHERNMSRTTLTALISQMNPHFLFNALNTIQSFIYSNDKKNASNYLGKFSELTRKVLDNSSKKAISLNEEIALLQLYLDIEKVRFGDNFTAIIATDPCLERDEIFFPPMLVQPYVENAIKHGLLHKQDKKEIFISINGLENKKEIEIIIDDNGIGRSKSMEINTQRTSHLSFANTANEKRIDLINQGLDKKITFEIIDKKNEKGAATGTKIILVIPIMSESLT